jgi:hypothetical protein
MSAAKLKTELRPDILKMPLTGSPTLHRISRRPFRESESCNLRRDEILEEVNISRLARFIIT